MRRGAPRSLASRARARGRRAARDRQAPRRDRRGARRRGGRGRGRRAIDALATQAPLGELLAAPSAIEHAAIAACLLDCHDVERLRRVRARQPDDHARFNQHHLNWAAFHRVHAVDSRWQQDVITGQDPSLRCDRWSAWGSGDPRWRVRVIDTTGAGQDEVVAAVAAWVEGLLAAPERAPLRGAWWDES
ncbi:MAG: hypothetical protein R3A51_05605 [Nannocystaceae bacterium]